MPLAKSQSHGEPAAARLGLLTMQTMRRKGDRSQKIPNENGSDLNLTRDDSR
jgi:hypothetical protein